MAERIYFDNAATTPLDPLVLQAMMPYLTQYYGNPSSIYSYGRESRLAIENARKSVAANLRVSPGEIFFTSGGTESNNTAIITAVRDLGCRRIITSPIEHHATLHTVQFLEKLGEVAVNYVKMLPSGRIDLDDLEHLLDIHNEKCLVTLMHANNEIGTMLKLKEAGKICKKYEAIFHSDTVQTVGHYPIDLSGLNLHFISGSAHKFHGPKGVGILYVNGGIKIHPLIHGGSQERNMRAGTENVYGIVGFASALQLAAEHYEKDSKHILQVKIYMAEQLQQHIADVSFNGESITKSLYTVLSVNFPLTFKSEMLLYSLDMKNVCVSGGSACSSGVDAGSHVIKALHNSADKVTVRFSFSKNNTKDEVDKVIKILKDLI